MSRYRIELFKGKDRQWYWRRNGRVMAVSEGYTRRVSALRAARRLQAGEIVEVAQ